jgi:hypothetical protein
MRVALLLTAFLALQATSAFAQTAMPACNGDLTIVRVSQIKPGGSIQKFMAAVAAHKAWYRANGFTDNEIVTSRVIIRDEKTNAMKYSDTEVISYHIRAPGPEKTAKLKDAAWDAYVKLYQDTSEIKSEYLTCMPKFGK